MTHLETELTADQDVVNLRLRLSDYHDSFGGELEYNYKNRSRYEIQRGLQVSFAERPITTI